MEEFVRVYNDYNYTFQRLLKPGQKILCKVPKPTGNARSVKSITWSCQTDIDIQGTVVYETDSMNIIWEPFKDGAQVSPSVTAISIQNTSSTYSRAVAVWVVME